MLEELAKYDSYFREVALNICKDKSNADDLVNEMYIKLYDSNVEPNNLKYYAIQTIRNLFIDSFKKPKDVNIEDLAFCIKEDIDVFEMDDYQLSVLNKAKRLPFLTQNLLEESCDKSLRQIESDYNINYMYNYKRITKAREDVLGIDFDKKYNNRRRKS